MSTSQAPTEVSALIQRVRTLLDLTQAELAEDLGVTLQTVNRWENGVLVPKEEVQQTFEALRPQLRLLERLKAELTTVHKLTNGVDEKIRALSFSFKDVLTHRRAFETLQDHNTASIAELRQLREAAYGRLLVLQDEETNECRSFRIAWGSRGWTELSVYNRNAPIIRQLMSASAGETVSLPLPGGERDFKVAEVSVLFRHTGNALLGNYDNFQKLEFDRQPTGQFSDHVEDLRRAWMLSRETIRTSLRQRRVADVLGFKEEPTRPPLRPDSRAALSERFFMQPEKLQEDAMQWAPEGHVLVTGPAGSGKTSVALGRAAMLCMRTEEDGDSRFRPETGVGFVLSDQLVGYLEELLTGRLGLDRMRVRSFTTLRQDLLTQRGFIGRVVKRDHTSKQDSITGSLAFYRLVEQRMVAAIARVLREALPKEPTVTVGDNLVGVGESHWQALEQPWTDLLKGIEETLDRAVQSRTLRGLVSRIDSQRERFARRLETLTPWDTPKLKDARRRVRDRVKEYVMLAFDYAARYFEIVGSDEFVRVLEQEFGHQTHFSEVVTALRQRNSVKQLSDGDIDCLLLIAHVAAEGYKGRDGAAPIYSLAETNLYSHVFIDEVQDFTPVQVRLMAAQANAPDRAVTAVGDFAQRLERWGVRTPADLGLDLDGEREVHLGFNKRQRRPLHELVNAYRIRILDDHREVQGESPLANDEKPRFHWVHHDEEAAVLERILLQTREDHPDFSIAVLCPDKDRATELEHDLHDSLWSNNLLSRVSAQPQDAVKLCDAYHVHFTTPFATKGLEFDAVFVIDVDSYDLSDEVNRHALYVALSRARRRLDVFCKSMPPGNLGSILDQYATVAN